MATLENCHTCYPVSAPECAESYIISGLTPADELVAIATDRFGRTSRVDNETPVNDDGELTLVFPDGMTAWHAPKLSIRLYRLSDYENNRQLCAPLTMTICDVDYSCITLSFHQHSEEVASVALICQCTNNDCPAICLTLSSDEALPVPPTGCEFALVEFFNGQFHQELWSWDGVQWNNLADAEIDTTEGAIKKVNLTLAVGWSAIVDGVTYDTTQTINFDPALTSVDVTFISPTGCQYVMETIEVSGFGVNIEDTYLPSVPFDYNDLAAWNTYLGTDFTYLSSQSITSFTQFLLWNPSAPITIPAGAFAGWETFGVGEINSNKRSVIEVGANAFFDMATSNSNPYDINPDIIGDGAFGYTVAGTSPLVGFNFSNCTQLGSTSGDDGVFANVTGNTITATFNSVLQTNNAGGVDGDIAYLIANNTVTITWV